MEKVTTITILDEKSRDHDFDKNYTLDDDNLSKSISDLTLDLSIRLEAMNRFYEKEGPEETIEVVNKLAIMYQLAPVSSLRQFLFAICEQSSINAFLKSIAAKALRTENVTDELGYKAIDIIYPQMGDDIGTPYKIEFVKLLMFNDEYRTQALEHFCDIINDTTIDCDYRYKAILGLETEKNDEKSDDNDGLSEEQVMFYTTQSCLSFVNNTDNMTLYRILAGQYLLRSQVEQSRQIEQILLSFAKDETLDYNLRADATDVLLQLGCEEIKETAREIIMTLGRLERPVRTIYDNAQNVHTEGVEESVQEALEFLHTFNVMKKNGLSITFDYVEEQIKELISAEKEHLGIEKDAEWEKEEKILVALNRIYMDRAIYSKYSCRLEDVLLRVWTYLSGHDSEEDMKERLLEELEEMSGTCSSGFITRLINTISGYGDFSIRISWREQIIANLSGRLNARARELDNLDLQEKILTEMAIESGEYQKRKHFLRFLRQNVLSIREELFEEFKDHIEDTDFDLYFRAAISTYESGNFT